MSENLPLAIYGVIWNTWNISPALLDLEKKKWRTNGVLWFEWDSRLDKKKYVLVVYRNLIYKRTQSCHPNDTFLIMSCLNTSIAELVSSSRLWHKHLPVLLLLLLLIPYKFQSNTKYLHTHTVCSIETECSQFTIYRLIRSLGHYRWRRHIFGSVNWN